MPAVIPAAIAGKKRKREVHPETSDTESAILLLEEQILASRKNYNRIVTLLDHARKDDRNQEAVHSTLAWVVLCRIFCRMMALGNLSTTRQAPDNERAIVQWLNDRFDDYKGILLKIISKREVGQQSTALTLLMKLVKEEVQYLNLSEDSSWRNGTFASIIEKLVHLESATELRDDFVQKYVEEFDDVRFYAFGRLRTLAAEGTNGKSLDNIISMLAAIENIPETKDELEDFFLARPSKPKHELYSLSAHRRQAQEAWLAVLRNDLNKQQRKMILGLMSHRIAPWFLKVELLMDFLTDSFNQGGATSLLALSGLFYLIQERNLDYPQFYHKVYSLLDAEVLHSKHRSRFFRLLNTFLSSTHLPAALVASFIKRLSRLSLNAPPSAVVVVVPWIYNLLKGHPACTFTIHRTSTGPDGEDPFLVNEPDPMETYAIESSLWEVHALQDHYHPNVATIARIISEQFTKQAYNLEDFLDHSYDSMLNAELAKDVKKPPEIEYYIPKKIFTKHVEGSEGKDSILVKLCDFG